jgi:K(+)-stimulated pyrophosphate-energized sodium pump
MTSILFCLTVGAIGILNVILSYIEIVHMPALPEIAKIGLLIRKGALAYLKKQYQILFPFIMIAAIISSLIFSFSFSVFFLLGALFSILSGFIGMNLTTLSNFKTTHGARESITKALYIGFTGGSGMGIITCSLGIIGISLTYVTAYFFLSVPLHEIIIAYSLGASMVALFARVGGGIFTKAADIGADLVGKLEANIPEDDPRNPAVIADNVGDNVGDVAGMGADLFGSYIGAIYGCIALLSIILKNQVTLYLEFVLYLLSLGLLSSIFMILMSRLLISKKQISPSKIINNLGIFSGLVCMIATYFLSQYLLQNISVFYTVSVGIGCGILIGIITNFYTSKTPMKSMAKTSMSGAAPNILSGISYGMESTCLTIVVICLSIGINYGLLNILGIAFGGLGMMLTLASTIAVDAYGPIVDNAGGIAEMSHQPEEVRERTDLLDSIGNTTAAIGKNFAIGSAALTVLTFLYAFTYSETIKMLSIDLSISNTNLMIGLLIGGMLPFLFSSFTIKAVTITANIMVKEVRHQFKTIVGLWDGKSVPDYEKCIQISTVGALHGMILPALTGIVPPFILFAVGGPAAVAGLIAGSLASGVMLAIFMSNAGGAWDNAKKLIESGKFGGKGSVAHISAIIGDTVGDPLKDTAGPSLNILIKLIAIVSLLFIPLFLR